jgi:hypothetical protein
LLAAGAALILNSGYVPNSSAVGYRLRHLSVDQPREIAQELTVPRGNALSPGDRLSMGVVVRSENFEGAVSTSARAPCTDSTPLTNTFSFLPISTFEPGSVVPACSDKLRPVAGGSGSFPVGSTLG